MPHTGRHLPLFLLLPVLAVILCASCGYRLAADSPSVLGDGSRTLKVKGVDYPTLEPWLPYEIRSRLRDEITARHLAKWVDEGPADYEIQINVRSFTSREWMRSTLNTTMLFETVIAMEAIVYRGDSNQEVWRSGPLQYTDRLEDPGAKFAAGDLLTQLMRMLADKMRNTF